MSETVKEFKPLFFIGMPTGSNHPHSGTAEMFFLKPTRRYTKVLFHRSASVLTQNFNVMWSAALNFSGVTHFAMLHDDVIPCEWWVDILYDEMVRTGADVVSCVNAIKDTKGLMSCGVGHPEDPFDYRRFTATEVNAMPETFGIEDVPDCVKEEGRDVFLVNTGCWIADIRSPVWRERNDDGTLKFTFTINDRITWDDRENRYVVEFAPEDWLFSRQCHEAGLKVVATTKAQTKHIGSNAYLAHVAWGDLSTDTEAVEFHRTKPFSIERVLT